MSELVYKMARQKAEEYLRDYWDGTFPVKLTPIGNALNATKYETPLDGLSGVVVKQARQGPQVVLNSDESIERRRFTWAHELGHIIERKEVAADEDYSFTEARGNGYSLHEFFADEFAGALLMPEDAITEMQNKNCSIAQMASHFGVSLSAMNMRLQRLSKQQ